MLSCMAFEVPLNHSGNVSRQPSHQTIKHIFPPKEKNKNKKATLKQYCTIYSPNLLTRTYKLLPSGTEGNFFIVLLLILFCAEQCTHYHALFIVSNYSTASLSLIAFTNPLHFPQGILVFLCLNATKCNQSQI